MGPLQKLQRRNLVIRGFESSIVLFRVLFGLGWLLAGITKIIGKSWFSEPGAFLGDYLIDAMGKSNVPRFYKYLIEHVALDHVLFLNYSIPLVQIVLGCLLIAGLLTYPSVLICLFMHINFILSGNMTLISLTLYTSAFSLVLCGRHAFMLSLDRYFKLENLFAFHKEESQYLSNRVKEKLNQETIKMLLQESVHEIIATVEEMQVAQNQRIEKLITYLDETQSEENKKSEKELNMMVSPTAKAI